MQCNNNYNLMIWYLVWKNECIASRYYYFLSRNEQLADQMKIRELTICKTHALRKYKHHFSFGAAQLKYL